MSAAGKWFAVRFNTDDGDEQYAICQSVEGLHALIQKAAPTLLTLQMSATTEAELSQQVVDTDHGLEDE